MTKTMLILAHADDECISAGGLIQNRLAAGGEVSLTTVFGRKYNYGIGPQYVKEQMADYNKSCQTLGLKQGDYHPLLLSEGEPQSHSHYDVLHKIESFMEMYQPTEVVIHGSEDLNQDHRWLHEVCKIALRPTNLNTVRRVLACVALDGSQPKVNYFVPMTAKQVGTSLAALEKYRRESRSLPSPRAPENLQAHWSVNGARCGEVFAEPFQLLLERA